MTVSAKCQAARVAKQKAQAAARAARLAREWGLRCPLCRCPHSRVLKTRPAPWGLRRWRRCLNPECGHEYLSRELAEPR